VTDIVFVPIIGYPAEWMTLADSQCGPYPLIQDQFAFGSVSSMEVYFQRSVYFEELAVASNCRGIGEKSLYMHFAIQNLTYVEIPMVTNLLRELDKAEPGDVRHPNVVIPCDELLAAVQKFGWAKDLLTDCKLSRPYFVKKTIHNSLDYTGDALSVSVVVPKTPKW